MSIVFLALLDRLHQRRDAVVRLDDQLHFVPWFFFSSHSTAAWPSGSSFRMRVRHAIGLDLERHLHVVADLFVGRGAQLEV